ncbi:LysR family transcriptional regulator [Agromyces larvae]|uniref:LysR family transcriptional regulator n=1 Tax=Agromyces larvae TaxID=2929802 RepID=A0ABY4C761_9MICO|nr:LysR family transcriptional regulator [Agromyces larvae]UOE45838.1 LysR family transcriptional regulator [Agromyces larvae]
MTIMVTMLACVHRVEKDRFGRDSYPGGMNQVESRPLRYFVAVAEELNFTRAAERLGIASPALSRAVSALEADLGVRLFERSTRRVALTEVGVELLVEARTALGALDAATERARRSARVRGGKLVLAVKADVEGGLLEEVLSRYDAEQPSVPLEVVFTGWREQPALVRSGEADVTIVVEPFDTEGLDSEPLLSEPQLLALPADHPLAGRHGIHLTDLEAEHHPAAPGSHVYVPRGGGLPPFGDLTQMLRQIELGRMLALLPASVAERNTRSQLEWRPVVDAPPATFAVAWPERSSSLSVAAFVRIALAVAADRTRITNDRSRTAHP